MPCRFGPSNLSTRAQQHALLVTSPTRSLSTSLDIPHHSLPRQFTSIESIHYHLCTVSNYHTPKPPETLSPWPTKNKTRSSYSTSPANPPANAGHTTHGKVKSRPE